MKSLRKNVIFALVFGVVLGAAPVKGYSDSLSRDSNTKAYVIANGSQKEFVGFIKEELTAFSRLESWNVIETVVGYYGEKPSRLMSVPVEQREAFNKAVSKLSNKLQRRKDAEAQQWKRNLDKTANSIRFIWNFDLNSLTPVTSEIPPLVVPTAESNL
ncbi:hypothetical protein [Telluribacter sp.]|jgi:hypothetical protein|uniref:hypothetical protein n=1 Tax=Telluribacter sp. TaxID=1978767 RepID=UPI002E12E3E3|nr:hypothetical protein [Telluribacter sp.]